MINNREVTVILARITQAPDDELTNNINGFNNHLRIMADSRIANGDNILTVNMMQTINRRFESEGGDIVDDAVDIHPNDEGYAAMAEYGLMFWNRSYQARLKTGPQDQPVLL